MFALEVAVEKKQMQIKQGGNEDTQTRQDNQQMGRNEEETKKQHGEADDLASRKKKTTRGTNTETETEHTKDSRKRARSSMDRICY
eukprot:4102088-Amphidinium_carterae.1